MEHSRKRRFDSIDILRGLIIILMALDHTRDFFGQTTFAPTDLSQTDTAWFLTRWITHFCAPLFIFLAGVSAFLYGKKAESKSELRYFLISRGIWLILVEIVIVNYSWQFAFDFIFIQVIWAIGWSMIILAGLITIPQKWLLALSLLIIATHNAIDDVAVANAMGRFDWLWAILHQQQWLPMGNGRFGAFIGYPLIPWFAVMSLGYATGSIFLKSPAERQKILLVSGGMAWLVFVLLRTWVDYGDTTLWSLNHEHGHPVLSLLNTTKYPPSLQFLCMTIGPGLILLSLMDRLGSKQLSFKPIYWLHQLGRVPMFFYLLHVPLIHVAALTFTYFYYGEMVSLMASQSAWPDDYKASLGIVYVAWGLIVAALYIPCRNFARYKQANKSRWLSYL